ncbi:hypothetical protein K5D33_06425 [Pseudomonas cichorii]|nr:hypothetical protein [Pseudomonas cichorii]MBX8488503.1 hypothetical protein [Pseudomonas cichorii]MBX8534357.1 hypothetical protein [Pseudomonas cichorii]MBX8538948.1 hypothetical protein [Pseudomonas cichorii]MBX8553113.1 hypothetical protein [Pseudomonas cichorii]MBX8578760.1 hypothetical protein [Pseudomonas cichorii]
MEILLEYVFRAIFFPVGWPVVKILTLGKYPVKGSWLAHTPQSEWTSGIGIAVLLIAMMAALKQFVIP